MRVLVGLSRLELGGMQLNAIDLAASLRDRGHEVQLFGEREPDLSVLDVAAARGLTVGLVEPTQRRATRLASALSELVERHRSDVVHAYGSWLGWGSFLGPHRRWGTPLVTTVYTHYVPRWLPRTPHLVVGTAELVDATRRWYRGPVHLVEPPVDVRRDDADAVDPGEFLRAHRLDPDNRRIVIVSRLASTMKLEGLQRAIAAVEALSGETVDLVLVGSGDAQAELQDRADRANARIGRRAVVLTGALADPRPAYAAADLVLGMGGSAIRALSFGKPLVVLGERGFSLPFDERTVEVFLGQGFYGIGNGDVPASQLTQQIRGFLDDPTRMKAAGLLGRRMAVERFSLEAASARLEGVCQDAVETPRGRIAWCREALYASGYRAAGSKLPAGIKSSLKALR